MRIFKFVCHAPTSPVICIHVTAVEEAKYEKSDGGGEIASFIWQEIMDMAGYTPEDMYGEQPTPEDASPHEPMSEIKLPNMTADMPTKDTITPVMGSRSY